ncbi:beta-glucosidase [Terribacillus halophilus]|uniref:Beta-glucosidase n=1 Tax=Terribacillus halophilus TaxID=361279 RepID=A0A1G6QLR2_9BACI|nr:glycoside hydrolase family 1 protein [Terribacillus halophilus]SDC93258.1 beta-glucosidase [Terribacillus halophilus]
MTQQIRIPDRFILGAAASAWQTEGWSGKKEGQDSYLDVWYKQNRHVWHNGYGPAVATDFYHRYQEDIGYMKDIGLTHYRTSINWSRFLIDYEEGIVDETYAAYMESMIDELLSQGIKPMICLEHYEVPAYLLEKYDGWSSRDVVNLFVLYAQRALERFGEKVDLWFTFNEPIVPQTRIYLDAIRYPYEQNTKKWMQWNYHKSLATAKVVALFRSLPINKRDNSRIGIILNPEVTYPRSSAPHDKQAAEIYDLFYNRVFLDPSIRGTYPEELVRLLKKHNIMFEAADADLAVIKEHTVDIVGLNLYYPHRVKAPAYQWHTDTPFHPAFYYDKFDLPGRKMNPYRGWEIYPSIIYDMGMRMKEEYGNMPWFVAESGMGVENEQRFRGGDGRIEDDYRIAFIREHLAETLRVTQEGSNCLGYMLWAFTDNVSPMNAFKNRYGLVEIDLEKDRNRRLKKSAYWYQQVIQSKLLNITEEEYK